MDQCILFNSCYFYRIFTCYSFLHTQGPCECTFSERMTSEYHMRMRMSDEFENVRMSTDEMSGIVAIFLRDAWSLEGDSNSAGLIHVKRRNVFVCSKGSRWTQKCDGEGLCPFQVLAAGKILISHF